MGKTLTALSRFRLLRGDDLMFSVPEDSSVNATESVRAAGYAAFAWLDWDMAVMDLEHDSAVDSPDGQINSVRHLRFVGHESMIEVDVLGSRCVIVDVSVSPTDSVVVELRTQDEHGQSTILWSRGLILTRIRPQLTSFFLRWPKSTRRPARTAWVLL